MSVFPYHEFSVTSRFSAFFNVFALRVHGWFMQTLQMYCACHAKPFSCWNHLTFVQTCTVTRVHSATERTASVHTLHMSKPVV